MAEASDDDLKRLRWLSRLVAVLTLTMIAGVVTITALLVTRLTAPAAVPLPETVELPDGARAVAVTAAADWYAIVTEDQRLLVYDRARGTLTREVDLGD